MNKILTIANVKRFFNELSVIVLVFDIYVNF